MELGVTLFVVTMTMSAGLLFAAFYVARDSSLHISMLSAMTLLVCALIPAIHAANFGFSISHPSLLLGAITDHRYFYSYGAQVLLIAVFLLVAALVIRKDDWRGSVYLEFREHQADLAWLESVAYWACLVGVGVYLVGTDAHRLLFQGDWVALFVRSRMDFYEHGSLLLVNVGFYLMSFIAVFFFCWSLGERRRAVRLLTILLLVAFLTVFSGGRKWVILAFSGAMAAYILRHGFNRRLIGAGVVGVFALALLQFLRSTVFKSGEWSADDLARILLTGDIVYFYMASVEAIRYFHIADMFHPFATIRAILFLPFPTELTFGLKVPDLAHIFGEAFTTTGIRDNNNPPGLIGLGAINLGPGGFLVVGWLALLLQFIERVKLPAIARVIVLANSIYLLTRLVRGSIGGIYIVVFELLAVLAIIVVLPRIRTQNSDAGSDRQSEAGRDLDRVAH